MACKMSCHSTADMLTCEHVEAQIWYKREGLREQMISHHPYAGHLRHDIAKHVCKVEASEKLVVHRGLSSIHGHSRIRKRWIKQCMSCLTLVYRGVRRMEDCETSIAS